MRLSTVDWSAPLGPSWSGVAVANGLVFAGSNDTAALFVHDASTGALLNTLTLASTSASGAVVVDGVVYVGYGIINANGGVMAFGLQ
jgi:outer membrane protein assembly factor BamB